MKWNAHFSQLIYLIVLMTCVHQSWAAACDSIKLPEPVKSTLQREFIGWKIVTPELLSSTDDRQIWNERFASECPGIIRGHFTGPYTEYAISLIRGSGKMLEQQILMFKSSHEVFKKVVLDPPSHVAVVTVLRKFAPGVYKSPESARSVRVPFDTIGVSEIEAGTVVYYWNGKQFRHIQTSV